MLDAFSEFVNFFLNRAPPREILFLSTEICNNISVLNWGRAATPASTLSNTHYMLRNAYIWKHRELRKYFEARYHSLPNLCQTDCVFIQACSERRMLCNQKSAHLTVSTDMALHCHFALVVCLYFTAELEIFFIYFFGK